MKKALKSIKILVISVLSIALIGFGLLMAMYINVKAEQNGYSFLACLAYWDHCTGIKIEGLTPEQCFQNYKGIAYYNKDKICLIEGNDNFLDVDDCLDKGGSWRYDLKICNFSEKNSDGVNVREE